MSDLVNTRNVSDADIVRVFRGAACVAAMTALLGLGTTTSAAHSLKALEDKLQEPAPDFTLPDAQGREIVLADFRGKVVVLNFIYTNCPDICPLHSERIAEIQEMIEPTPMRELVQFISITTDTLRDTWSVMKDYGPDHGLDPASWMFLSSGPDALDATRDLAGDYGLKFTLTDSGYQMHGLVTFLIDKSGNIRARYHGLKFHPTNFILQVNALTNDDH